MKRVSILIIFSFLTIQAQGAIVGYIHSNQGNGLFKGGSDDVISAPCSGADRSSRNSLVLNNTCHRWTTLAEASDVTALKNEMTVADSKLADQLNALNSLTATNIATMKADLEIKLARQIGNTIEAIFDQNSANEKVNRSRLKEVVREIMKELLQERKGE